MDERQGTNHFSDVGLDMIWWNVAVVLKNVSGKVDVLREVFGILKAIPVVN